MTWSNRSFRARAQARFRSAVMNLSCWGDETKDRAGQIMPLSWTTYDRAFSVALNLSASAQARASARSFSG